MKRASTAANTSNNSNVSPIPVRPKTTGGNSNNNSSINASAMSALRLSPVSPVPRFRARANLRVIENVESTRTNMKASDWLNSTALLGGTTEPTAFRSTILHAQVKLAELGMLREDNAKSRGFNVDVRKDSSTGVLQVLTEDGKVGSPPKKENGNADENDEERIYVQNHPARFKYRDEIKQYYLDDEQKKMEDDAAHDNSVLNASINNNSNITIASEGSAKKKKGSNTSEGASSPATVITTPAKYLPRRYRVTASLPPKADRRSREADLVVHQQLREKQQQLQQQDQDSSYFIPVDNWAQTDNHQMPKPKTQSIQTLVPPHPFEEEHPSHLTPLVDMHKAKQYYFDFKTFQCYERDEDGFSLVNVNPEIGDRFFLTMERKKEFDELERRQSLKITEEQKIEKVEEQKIEKVEEQQPSSSTDVASAFQIGTIENGSEDHNVVVIDEEHHANVNPDDDDDAETFIQNLDESGDDHMMMMMVNESSIANEHANGERNKVLTLKDLADAEKQEQEHEHEMNRDNAANAATAASLIKKLFPEADTFATLESIQICVDLMVEILATVPGDVASQRVLAIVRDGLLHAIYKGYNADMMHTVGNQDDDSNLPGKTDPVWKKHDSVLPIAKGLTQVHRLETWRGICNSISNIRETAATTTRNMEAKIQQLSMHIHWLRSNIALSEGRVQGLELDNDVLKRQIRKITEENDQRREAEAAQLAALHDEMGRREDKINMLTLQLARLNDKIDKMVSARAMLACEEELRLWISASVRTWAAMLELIAEGSETAKKSDALPVLDKSLLGKYDSKMLMGELLKRATDMQQDWVQRQGQKDLWNTMYPVDANEKGSATTQESFMEREATHVAVEGLRQDVLIWVQYRLDEIKMKQQEALKLEKMGSQLRLASMFSSSKSGKQRKNRTPNSDNASSINEENSLGTPDTQYETVIEEDGET